MHELVLMGLSHTNVDIVIKTRDTYKHIIQFNTTQHLIWDSNKYIEYPPKKSLKSYTLPLDSTTVGEHQHNFG